MYVETYIFICYKSLSLFKKYVFVTWKFPESDTPAYPVEILGTLLSLNFSRATPSPIARTWREKHWVFTPARPHSKPRGGVSDLPTLSSLLLPLLKETIGLLGMNGSPSRGFSLGTGRDAILALVCACVCATSVVMSAVQNTLQDPSGWVGQWTLFHLISHNAANSAARWSGERRRVKSWSWEGMNP